MPVAARERVEPPTVVVDQPVRTTGYERLPAWVAERVELHHL